MNIKDLKRRFFLLLFAIAVSTFTIKAKQITDMIAVDSLTVDSLVINDLTIDNLSAYELEVVDSIKPIQNILFIGDSMTGWLSERFAAYGVENGFKVSTVVWDGSTISKWAKSRKLPEIIKKYSPDAVFICLGLNELFERNPDRNLSRHLQSILQSIGEIPYLWIGPPSWPGKGKGDILNEWLQSNLDDNSFYYSGNLELPRQSRANPHPTRSGVIEWADKIIEWLSQSNNYFPNIKKPEKAQMVRGEKFIYKRMNETL